MLLKGKWTLEKLLGTGGMASVYLGVHRNGSKVAVKILHAHLMAHHDTMRRFLNEGYLANKVEHPGVVTVLDDDVAPDGSPFLVMELLDGKSLDAVLDERGALPMKHAVDLACRVLDVLGAAHEKGVVHRDLKPANIFLLNDGRVKVLDFGIARLREATAQAPSMATMGGAILGTPAFMPPEQAMGRWQDVDLRSDIWAMGATLFMLLANKSVRDEAESTNEALIYAMAKPVGPMAELLPQVPSPVGHCIDRALAFDKNARWPNARAMKAGLERALIDIGESAWETILDVPRRTMATSGPTPFVHVHTPHNLENTGSPLDGTMLSPQGAQSPFPQRASHPSYPPPRGSHPSYPSSPGQANPSWPPPHQLQGPNLGSHPQGPRLASRPAGPVPQGTALMPPPQQPLFTGVRSPSGPPPAMAAVDQSGGRPSYSTDPQQRISQQPMVASGMSTTQMGKRSKVGIVIGALAVTIVLTFSIAILLLFFSKDDPRKGTAGPASASVSAGPSVALPTTAVTGTDPSNGTAIAPMTSVSASATTPATTPHGKPKPKPADPLDKGRF